MEVRAARLPGGAGGPWSPGHANIPPTEVLEHRERTGEAGLFRERSGHEVSFRERTESTFRERSPEASPRSPSRRNKMPSSDVPDRPCERSRSPSPPPQYSSLLHPRVSPPILCQGRPLGEANQQDLQLNPVVDEEFLRRILREELANALRPLAEYAMSVNEKTLDSATHLQEPAPSDDVTDGAAQDGAREGHFNGTLKHQNHAAAGTVGFVQQAPDKSLLSFADTIQEDNHEDALNWEYELRQWQQTEHNCEQVLGPIAKLILWVKTLKEPRRDGKLAEVVESHAFEIICGVIISLNAFLTFFTTNWAMDKRTTGDPMPGYVHVVEIIFLLLYAIELFLKLKVHQLFFFCNANWHWNTFDFILVTTAIYDTIASIIWDSSTLNLVWMRTLRMLRMVKVLRVFRLMRFLSELRLILNSLVGCRNSLFWSIVMMTLIFYMFGLVFVQSATNYITDSVEIEEQVRQSIMTDWGSVQKAMLSLFKATTGGADWGIHHQVFHTIGPVSSLFYLFFVAFTQIALMNILTALFVENALKLAEPDRQAQYSEQQRKEAAQVRELRNIMKEMDTDGNGMISEEEFRSSMMHPRSKLRMYLGAMGVHTSDAERFYSMLEAASFTNKVDINGFVCSCMKLRGNAMSLDLQALTFEMRKLHLKVHELHNILLAADRDTLCTV